MWDEGAAALASRSWPALRLLSLRCNYLAADAALALSAAVMPALRVLLLDGNYLCTKEVSKPSPIARGAAAGAAAA